MPISFSIAGLRAVKKKPKPQLLSGNNNQNQKPNEIKVAAATNNGNNNNNNGESATSASNEPPSNHHHHHHPALASKPPPSSQALHHKYPGSGKLTIIQKKGKTGGDGGGYKESIIHRVPIYNEDYDSSDDDEEPEEEIYIPPRLLLQTDEEILMDQLDAEITRQEEKELLDRWNDEILEQEEADLMRRLSINIEHAEYLEKCAATNPSVVTLVEDINEAATEETSPMLLSVQVPKKDHPPPPQKLVFPPAIGDPLPSIAQGVEITEEIDFCKARIRIPRYLDQDHLILAFTRAEFYTGVIQPFKDDVLSIIDKSLYKCRTSLLVSDEDPFSYVLEARGPREVLDEFRRQAEFWIQDRIQMVNSRMLMRDGASVVITYGVNPRLTDGEIKSEKANYHERVVVWIERQFGWIDHKENGDKADTFLESWKVKEQFKADPDKCVITAKGTTEMLQKLEELSKNWVETESLVAHSFKSDPLQSSAKGGPHIQKLRMTFRLSRYVPLGYVNRSMKLSKTQLPSPRYSNNGVWLSGIKDGTRLAFMLGGPEVFDKGCSLLAIDGKQCNSPKDVQQIYSDARDKVKNTALMTVCLSRYTDFMAIPDFVDLTPTRLDGKPFVLSDYEKPELIVTTTMEQEEKEERQRQANEERPVPVEQAIDVEEQPVDDAGFEQPDFAASDDEDVQRQEQPNVDPFNDSDSDHSAPTNEKKKKRIPKKKDSSTSKITSTNAASRPGKRVAESVIAAEAQIPKKARAAPAKKTATASSTSNTSTPSTNPSRTALSNGIRPSGRLEKANAQKTKSISHAATVHESSSVAKTSGRAPSHGTASAPLADLHVLKPPAKQKRAPSTQPIGGPAGKKHKGGSTEVNRNAARPVSEPAVLRRKSNEPIGSVLFREYEIEFPYNEPIGAFFKTEGSKCKVFSVFKKGNAMKDRKIMPGTIAVAISISGNRKDISTHVELREHYFLARRRQAKIHIFFVDSDVVSHKCDLKSDLDWTESGVWTGRYEGGWAGGAKDKNSVVHMTNKLAGSRELGNDSILETNGPSMHSTPERRKVKFSNSNAVKEFVVGSPVDQQDDRVAKSPVDSIEDAVMNHRHTKLIEVLETGMTSDPDVVDFLRNFYDEYVKGAANEDNKDMQAKKKVIGIYLDMCLYVEQAVELKHTSNFKFCIRSIKLQKKPNSRTFGRTEILSGRVSVKRVKDAEELGSLHKTETKASITYNDSERRVFLVSGNSQLKLGRCDLFIDFREGAGGDVVPAAKIGSVKIPFAEIDLKCPIDKPWIIGFDLKPGSILSKGTVELEFQRSKKDKENMEKQRRKLTKNLKDQISFIKRFNEDFGGLTANIHSAGNVTPLHAAINLQEEGMVKQLVDLGANPRVESSRYGSPTNLATELKERSHKKLLDLINDDSPASATEPVQELYNKYSRILKLFLKPKSVTAGAESDEIQRYSVWASGASEDEQRKRLFETMHEIFSSAPNAAAGLKDGLEASKNYVYGNLRLYYSNLCPDIVSVKKFMAEAIRLKVLVSISSTKFMLGAADGSQDADNATKKKEAPLPNTQLNWIYAGNTLCHDYLRGGCKFGKNCRKAHIYQVPQDEKSLLVLASKELLRKKDKFKLDKEHVKTKSKDGWSTARYYNPKKSKSTYYHAQGGKGKTNQFGVNWYPTLYEAKDALQRVLTFKTLSASRRREIESIEKSKNRANSSSQSNDQNKTLPHLKDKDWMDKVVAFPRCPEGEDPKRVENCDFWTVEDRFGDTIGHQLNITLDEDDVYIKEGSGYYTSAYADRPRKKIIYVEGGNSKISDQKVHWYLSESEARTALEPVVAASRKKSAAK